MPIQGPSDYLRWMVAWTGCGAIALGAALMVLPAHATSSPAFTYLHQVPIPLWGAMWATLGVAAVIIGVLHWAWVIGPLAATVAALMLWGGEFVHAAAENGGKGTVIAVGWGWLAGIVWLTAIRAAKVTPRKVRP